MKFYFKPLLVKKKISFFNIRCSNVNKIFGLGAIFKFIESKQTEGGRLVDMKAYIYTLHLVEYISCQNKLQDKKFTSSVIYIKYTKSQKKNNKQIF